MKLLGSQRPLLCVLALVVGIAGVWVFAQVREGQAHPGHQPFVSFATVDPVLKALANELPPQLKVPNERRWKSWAQHEDEFVRARLDQGALDSMVNLLLFGTSFTTQPRVITMNDPSDPAVQARLVDLLQGLRQAPDNERLVFLRNLLLRRGLDPDSSAGYEQTKSFVLENLRRVVQEQIIFRQETDEASNDNNKEAELSERSRVFRDRGISVDTTILSSFGIEGALRDMTDRAVLSKGAVTRVAVSVRLGLAEPGKIDLTAFDISQEVLEHLHRSRKRAEKGENYVVQLPRVSWPWAPEAVQYWRSFGSEIGTTVAPIQHPPALNGLETRAVAIRPEVVLSCKAVDLNVVFEQFNPSATRPFDLIIATNVFLYYDSLEQALALRNISTLLKSGGFFLTNDWLPNVPQIPMRAMGYTPVRYGESGDWGDNVFWWQRQ